MRCRPRGVQLGRQVEHGRVCQRAQVGRRHVLLGAPVGQEAGTATGADMVLSLREQDMLKGMLKAQLNGCWRPPGTGGGDEIPVVTLSWEMNPDGTLRTQPKVTHAPSTPAGQVYAEAAVRAVKTCEPFRLPPDKYEGGWRFIDWTFDPRELL